MAISSNELNLWLLENHVLSLEHYSITKTKESLSKAFKHFTRLDIYCVT